MVSRLVSCLPNCPTICMGYKIHRLPQHGSDQASLRFVEVPDLVNASSVIPDWDDILKYPTIKRLLQDHVKNSKWVDRKLFPLFQPVNELDLCIDKVRAIRHHAPEVKSMESRSLSDRHPLNNNIL
ncbi:unnamed protein product [Rodentolepis nana]|uniref:CTP_synth_N domain-containing protein n=1 Tax=Rodentolepis nana TaxID=102285 RepID=A0A0R3TND4_RODNA|nr:unnamed protein product [Rodentolepis nana]